MTICKHRQCIYLAVLDYKQNFKEEKIIHRAKNC